MDAEKARETIDSYGKIRSSRSDWHSKRMRFLEAHGYLSALEGKEVKALVDALVWVNGNISKRMATAEIQYVRDRIDGYLSAFKKAVGK